MDLKFIPNKTCPTCNAITIAESCRHHHCNGQGFEERTFQCGCVISWRPNFDRLEVSTKCPNSSEVLKLKADRRALKNALLELIKSSYISYVSVDL